MIQNYDNNIFHENPYTLGWVPVSKIVELLIQVIRYIRGSLHGKLCLPSQLLEWHITDSVG